MTALIDVGKAFEKIQFPWVIMEGGLKKKKKDLSNLGIERNFFQANKRHPW